MGCIDFRYLTEALTPDEALEILRRNAPSKPEREAALRRDGYPAYTTSAGWLGYSDEQLRQLCREGLGERITTASERISWYEVCMSRAVNWAPDRTPANPHRGVYAPRMGSD